MSKREDIKKVLIIGSGPIIIGQACEFDYSGTQACKALRKLGYEIVLVNSLYNIVDSFFVAKISEQAMTALSLATNATPQMVAVKSNNND